MSQICVTPFWAALAEELDRWHEGGLQPTFWWRDDDARQDTAVLRRLNQLSLDYAIALHLAVVPEGADGSLHACFAENPRLFALQHGYSHRNYAAADQRKCELGQDRPLASVVAELAVGRSALAGLLDEAFVAVLVPPWNRLNAALVHRLAGEGYAGLSTLGPRSAALIDGLCQVNVHIDLIDWKTRRFAGDERVLAQVISHLAARRSGSVDANEATGLMTHHLAHDEDCWNFCRRLFEFLQPYDVRWMDARELFLPAD